jgi:hypothetical protein
MYYDVMATTLLHPARGTPIIASIAKKRKGGSHKTPRQPVQIPVPWIQLARQLATKHKQPMVWRLITLIGEDATREGITNLPKYPWEEDDPPIKK